MQIFSHKDKVNIVRRTAVAIITLVVLAAATAAWFTLNKEVSANGMKMVVDPGSRLTIAKSPEALSTESSTVIFTEEAKNVKAATRYPDILGTSETGLWFNTNPNVVDFSTGLSKGSALTFEAVPRSDDGTYYVDYQVYLAAMKEPITVNSFVCTLSLYNLDSEEKALSDISYIKASTIDFYLREGNEDIYCDTLNLAGLTPDNSSTDSVRDEKTSVDLLKGKSLTFPLADSGEYVLITMRLYIDGGLTYFEQPSSDATADVIAKTFVHAEDLVLKNFELKVDFETQQLETNSSN